MPREEMRQDFDGVSYTFRPLMPLVAYDLAFRLARLFGDTGIAALLSADAAQGRGLVVPLARGLLAQDPAEAQACLLALMSSVRPTAESDGWLGDPKQFNEHFGDAPARPFAIWAWAFGLQFRGFLAALAPLSAP